MNILDILNLWPMRNLNKKGRIIIFKTFTLSKIVFLAVLIIFPDYINKEIEKNQEYFI